MRTGFRTRRVGAVLAVLGALAAGLASASSASAGAQVGAVEARASGYTQVVDKWISVRESDHDRDTGILVRNGDEVDVSASGLIWAGVWFTGRNGPRGWPGWDANNDSPLPGEAPFSLLGKIAEDGYFLVGDGRRWVYRNDTLGAGQTRLYLRINDDRPGNGSGSFAVHLVLNRPDATG